MNDPHLSLPAVRALERAGRAIANGDSERFNGFNLMAVAYEIAAMRDELRNLRYRVHGLASTAEYIATQLSAPTGKFPP